MSTLAGFDSVDDVLHVGRTILEMLEDPRSNATRVGRVLDAAEPLAEEVIRTAERLFDRGEIRSPAHAVTLMGYRRVERVVRGFVQRELARLNAGYNPDERPVAGLASRYAIV